MLEGSLSDLGAGRGILLDKHSRIIAGNKTTEVAAEIGMEKVIIVHTTGDTLVAVQRDDLDLNDRRGQARRMAYADNRVGQVSLDFDPVIIASDLEAGVALSGFFFDDELQHLLNPISENANLNTPNFDDMIDNRPARQCTCPECGHKFTP